MTVQMDKILELTEERDAALERVGELDLQLRREAEERRGWEEEVPALRKRNGELSVAIEKMHEVTGGLIQHGQRLHQAAAKLLRINPEDAGQYQPAHRDLTMIVQTGPNAFKENR